MQQYKPIQTKKKEEVVVGFHGFSMASSIGHFPLLHVQATTLLSDACNSVQGSSHLTMAIGTRIPFLSDIMWLCCLVMAVPTVPSYIVEQIIKQEPYMTVTSFWLSHWLSFWKANREDHKLWSHDCKGTATVGTLWICPLSTICSVPSKVWTVVEWVVVNQEPSILEALLFLFSQKFSIQIFLSTKPWLTLLNQTPVF